MSTPDFPPRIDRRRAIQWMLAATAALSIRDSAAGAAQEANGYGPDPAMVKFYAPGDVWPLTFTAAQRRAAVALCDLIIPADAASPSASAVGVPDFLDEWISSPYPAQLPDRRIVVDGLAWVDRESERRFSKVFAEVKPEEQAALCDDLALGAKAAPEHKQAAAFFKRFRDLTAGGYYTTAEGMAAIGYVGNRPSATFEGPPLAALQHVGLA